MNDAMTKRASKELAAVERGREYAKGWRADYGSTWKEYLRFLDFQIDSWLEHLLEQQ